MLPTQLGNKHTALRLLLKIPVPCASLYRPFFIKNRFRHFAEKILLFNTTDFRGDYRMVYVAFVIDVSARKVVG